MRPKTGTKTIRVYPGDYAFLMDLSRRLGITTAEALRKAITEDMTLLKVAHHQIADENVTKT